VLANTQSTHRLSEVVDLVDFAIAIIVLTVAQLLKVLVIGAANKFGAILAAGKLAILTEVVVGPVASVTLLRPLLIRFAVAIVVESVASLCLRSAKRVAETRLPFQTVDYQMLTYSLAARCLPQAVINIAVAIVVNSIAFLGGRSHRSTGGPPKAGFAPLTAPGALATSDIVGDRTESREPGKSLKARTITSDRDAKSHLARIGLHILATVASGTDACFSIGTGCGAEMTTLTVAHAMSTGLLRQSTVGIGGTGSTEGRLRRQTDEDGVRSNGTE